jgi:hypothetical protein
MHIQRFRRCLPDDLYSDQNLHFERGAAQQFIVAQPAAPQRPAIQARGVGAALAEANLTEAINQDVNVKRARYLSK